MSYIQDISNTVLDNQNVEQIQPIYAPNVFLSEAPVTTEIATFVYESRQIVKNIMNKQDDRLLLIIGPCSIHDSKAALDYASKLVKLKQKHQNELEIVMRVYFEKPRTSIGWKGLINDPLLNDKRDINLGLSIARKLLLEIQKLGLAAATEFLDVISPQYYADLITWGAIGARTTESQLHRELTSGLSVPVGFKNGTDGDIQIAIDAINSAKYSHTFLGATKTGQIAVVTTKGNQNCHVILRGGRNQTNYAEKDVNNVISSLTREKLNPSIMIDCSHGNSFKKCTNQILVAEEICRQIEAGSTNIFGVMVESNLVAGTQKFTPGVDLVEKLTYGQSITDECIGWQETEEFCELFANAIKKRRQL